MLTVHLAGEHLETLQLFRMCSGNIFTHLLDERAHEGFPEHFIIDVADMFVYVLLIHTAFSHKTVEMRVPDQRPSKCMEGDHDAGSEGVAFPAVLLERIHDGLPGRIEKEVEHISVLFEPLTEPVIDREYNMSMVNIKGVRGDIGSALLGIFDTA